MFHPAHPEQFSRVRRLLDDLIDRPARQIFVEGMVLEISEDGLRDLGIEWELRGGPISLNFGSEHADGLDDTLEVRSDDFDFWRILDGEFDYDVSARIRALIRDGKAEVLSRPSVLTLDNRQSTIRVGQDIPIATSQEGTASDSNKIAFTFSYLPTGILLNIRPRISEDGGEVSMLIDTIVSDVVPGEDLQIRSVDGELLASAPTVATRRVQTYARIRNNTPFIIGGLVARLDTTVMDKVPLLGDMPFIGALFRAERSATTKREVIIVLTPYVLPENGLANRAQPKDDDLFDNFGHELFRDSYRIRAEDVFDLHFLLENERLRAYRAAAAEAIAANFRLADEEPFHSFAKGAIPGEGALVTRMIYDVSKRLGAGERIPLEKVIFFAGLEADGYVVQFLENALARLGGGSDPDRFFDRQQGKALAITFRSGGTTWSDPVPEIALHDCPDRTAWGDLLWKLNQPDEAGRLRASILIHDESDLLRLRRAIAIKRIVDLNGGEKQLRLSTLGAGKVLFMPDFKPEQIHLVDPEVAHIFYFTEHYYAAALQAIEERLLELDEALRRPDLRALRAE
jgi:general secretion pathway protein D